MKKDDFGYRMKSYENISRFHLMRRNPIILRLDGRAFHTYTKRFKDKTAADPFSETMRGAMSFAMEKLCKEVQGVYMAYTQSDEVSLVLRDWETYESQQWFGGNKSKIESVSASIMTAYFNLYMRGFESESSVEKPATFDARAFTVPLHEVSNYFIWRQEDCVRNSVSMMAQHYFSHKELQGVSKLGMVDKLKKEKQIDYHSLDSWKIYGTVWKDGEVSTAPEFKYNRNYIEENL